MNHITKLFGEFVADTQEVPASARSAAARCILDLLGCAIAGYGTPGASAARRAAKAHWGNGVSPVWFSNHRLTEAGAAFANAAMACQLDLDDGHRLAAGHPGAAVIPSAFAIQELESRSASELLTAICLGYEIAVRIAASRDLQFLPTMDSGQWCGAGAVAVAGKLKGSSVDTIAHALAISGTTAPGQWATSYTKYMGNNVKEGIPVGTANGLLGLSLATEGFTGPVDIYDLQESYKRERLLKDLGSSWLIEGTYYKPYSACRWAHAPVDALLQILEENSLNASAIDSIEVNTFSRALTLNNSPTPASLEDAQYSIPFSLGLAASSGRAGLLPMTGRSLENQMALKVASKVTLEVDPELDRMFSKSVPARVTVTAGNRQFSKTVLDPEGEPNNPLTDADLSAKLETLCNHAGAPALAKDVECARSGLEDGNMGALLKLLNSPMPIRSAGV
jgi:2-methylcitrate dehydratase PrpD